MTKKEMEEFRDRDIYFLVDTYNGSVYLQAEGPGMLKPTKHIIAHQETFEIDKTLDFTLFHDKYLKCCFHLLFFPKKGQKAVVIEYDQGKPKERTIFFNSKTAYYALEIELQGRLLMHIRQLRKEKESLLLETRKRFKIMDYA